MDVDGDDTKDARCGDDPNRGFGFGYAVRIFAGPVLERVDGREDHGGTRMQAIADGADPDADAEGYLLVPPPHDLRRTLGLTQARFAALLRIPIGTVRNWEQGRTPPDPAARTLLALVAADTDHALRVLGSSHTVASDDRRRERSA